LRQAYYRVSTREQGRSGLGIDAQRAAVSHFAKAEGFEVIAEFTETETGKGWDALERRPQLAAALAGARSNGKACPIAVAKLDSVVSFSGQEKRWPAESVERRSVSELVPYARNARVHSLEQINQIAELISEWGWTVPVLVDEEGGIIAGHGRVLAAIKLGIDVVPTMVARGWTEAQKRAYGLVDNKLTLNAGWDDDLLRIELSGLQELNFDLGLTGFSDLELGDILADRTAGLTDPDDAPAEPANPVSETGDVWLLGSHRLLCGDSTNAADVEKALNGVKPHLMVTDPPYGVNYDPDWRNRAKWSNGNHGGRAVGTVENDGRADWREGWALFPGDVAYCWHAGLRANAVFDSFTSAGFEIRAQIIWAKNNLVIGRGNYHIQHEPCWYAVRKGKTAHWAGDRKQTTLWHIDKPQKSETGHSTQKPVECMRRPIENNSSPGQAVYEPFSGSGTTIIAGEMTGRAIHAIEIMPAYVDVAVLRWQAFTGKEAILDTNGKTFSEMKAERHGSGEASGRASAA
jgi:DNA modification methylase